MFRPSENRIREGWGPTARPGHGRVRAHKPAYGPYRNRTLVFKNVVDHKTTSTSKVVDRGDSPATTEDNTLAIGKLRASSTSSWITKHDRHTQLINRSVFGRNTQKRPTAIEESRRQRVLRNDKKDHTKSDHHIDITPRNSAFSTKTDSIDHNLQFNGLRFRVCNGGSKLLRDHCKYATCIGSHAYATVAVMTSTETPKRAVIGGVTFMRSKHGNLYRSGLVRATRYAYHRLGHYKIRWPRTHGAHSTTITYLSLGGKEYPGRHLSCASDSLQLVPLSFIPSFRLVTFSWSLALGTRD